jgi:hypothetical protein
MLGEKMARILAACGGFLLAVLWMDLMFDVQARRVGSGTGRGNEDVLDSIARYYRRVTTDAFPMNRLVGTVMALTVVGSVYQAIRAFEGCRLLILSPLLCGIPIGLAAFRVFPNAVRLGARVTSVESQADLARTILRDHVICFVAIGAFVAMQVWMC